MPHRIRELIARARALPPQRVDAGVAFLVVAAATTEAALVEPASIAARAGYVACAVVIAVAVCFRRRSPVAAMLAGVCALIGVGLLPKAVADIGGAPFMGVLFLIFSMSLRTEGRRLASATAAAMLLILVVMTTDQYDDKLSDYLFGPSLIVIVPVAVGQMLRSRAALTEALREKAQRAARGRELHAQQAVSDERARVAGELHDVIAHALGAMTIQAGAARRLTASDPARARDAFGAVESTGRDALTELRALLGVLRREDEELALAPQPRLANLRDLLRRTTASGLPVELAIDGKPPADLPAGVDLTAYRVVQEALGAALRHGEAGQARVRVRYGAGEVVVEVADDGRAQADRHLLGMHERVRVYGGRLQVGTGRDGGHRVRARLPVEAEG